MAKRPLGLKAKPYRNLKADESGVIASPLVRTSRWAFCLDVAQCHIWQGSLALAMFEMAITKSGPFRWDWRVCDQSGKPILFGREMTREAARYRCQRALFQLLLASTRKSA